MDNPNKMGMSLDGLCDIGPDIEVPADDWEAEQEAMRTAEEDEKLD